jgi:hypothetical protein
VPTGPAEDVVGATNLTLAQLTIHQMMRDGSELTETMLQWMSASPTARAIDLQVGDLSGDLIGPAPLLTYLRYEVELDADALAALGIHASPERVEALRRMEDAGNVETLAAIGERAAEEQVRDAHLPPVFDPPR